MWTYILGSAAYLCSFGIQNACKSTKQHFFKLAEEQQEQKCTYVTNLWHRRTENNSCTSCRAEFGTSDSRTEMKRLPTTTLKEIRGGKPTKTLVKEEKKRKISYDESKHFVNIFSEKFMGFFLY